jgi:hypothetical protein
VQRKKGTAPMTATWSTARGDRTAAPGIVPEIGNAGDPPPAGGSPGVHRCGHRCPAARNILLFNDSDSCAADRSLVSDRRRVARHDCGSVGVELDDVEDASTRLIQRSHPVSPGHQRHDRPTRQGHVRRARRAGTSPTTTPTASWATSTRPWSVATGWACNTSPQVCRICAPGRARRRRLSPGGRRGPRRIVAALRRAVRGRRAHLSSSAASRPRRNSTRRAAPAAAAAG